jgi:hypothetical protein
VRESAPEPKKGGGMMMIAIITFIAVAAAGGGGYWFWQQQQGSQASATAWSNVDPNDPAAIRAFINGNPGDQKDEAEQALAALEEQSFDAAKDADTIEALQQFVTDFPGSSHEIEARGRIAELQANPPQPLPGEGEPAAVEPGTADPDLTPPGTTVEGTTGGPAAITPPQAPTPEPQPTENPTN